MYSLSYMISHIEMKLAQTDKDMDVIFGLKMVLECWDRKFLGTTTIFQKNNIGWPQQPPTERVSDISKKLDFDNPFYKKGPVLVILVPEMIKPSGLGSFLVNEGFWGCRGQWGCRGRWGQWGCRGSKAWKITTTDFTESSGFLNSALFWCLEKTYFLVESRNIILNLCIFSILQFKI